VQVDFTPCRLGLSDYVTQSKYWTKGKEWVLDVARNFEKKQDLMEKSKRLNPRARQSKPVYWCTGEERVEKVEHAVCMRHVCHSFHFSHNGAK
jgi:hypothetical protein